MYDAILKSSDHLYLCVKPINFAGLRPEFSPVCKINQFCPIRVMVWWGWTLAGWFQTQCPMVWSHTLNTRLWLIIILKIMIISLIILFIIYDISHHKTSQTRFRRIPAGNCSGRYPRQRPIVWSDSLTHSGKRRQRCQRPRDPLLIQWWQHS